MSKDSRNSREESLKDYYKLNTEAVDALVNAENSETEVPQEELDKYRKKKFHIPQPILLYLIKGWFAGSVYYFVGFGLGIKNLLDQIVIIGVVLGLVTDLLTNNVIRFLEETPGANDRWMVFSRKSYASFLFNMLYGIAAVAAVAWMYWLINRMFDSDPNTIHVGTEPLLFGTLCALLDLLLVFGKRWIRKHIPHKETNC